MCILSSVGEEMSNQGRQNKPPMFEESTRYGVVFTLSKTSIAGMCAGLTESISPRLRYCYIHTKAHTLLLLAKNEFLKTVHLIQSCTHSSTPGDTQNKIYTNIQISRMLSQEFSNILSIRHVNTFRSLGTKA